MPPILMHINYFEHGYNLATLFDKAIHYGYDGVELRGNRGELSTEEYIAEVATEIQRTNITHVTMACPTNLNNPDPAEREAAVAKSADLLRRAAAIGVRVFNTMAGPMLNPDYPYTDFHKQGSGYADWQQWQWAVDGYRDLCRVAEELDVILAFETHNGYIHDLAKPTAELLRRIDSPAIGANLDMGNIVLNSDGESADDAVDILGDKIYYLHLKNMFKISGQPGFIPCPLSDGCIDNRSWMRRMRQIGYKGLICLEAPRQGDRDQFARQDIEYFRGLLADICWQD